MSRPRSVNGMIREAKERVAYERGRVERLKDDLAAAESLVAMYEAEVEMWKRRKAEDDDTEAKVVANGNKVTRGGYNSNGPPNPEPGDVHYLGTTAVRWTGTRWERLDA